MSITVYVIKSAKNKFRYVGITKDVEKRMKQHNNGHSKSTQNYKPFQLIYIENFQNYKEARKKEIFLKSGQGRKFLDKL